jgi:hypothetical protein
MTPLRRSHTAASNVHVQGMRGWGGRGVTGSLRNANGGHPRHVGRGHGPSTMDTLVGGVGTRAGDSPSVPCRLQTCHCPCKIARRTPSHDQTPYPRCHGSTTPHQEHLWDRDQKGHWAQSKGSPQTWGLAPVDRRL